MSSTVGASLVVDTSRSLARGGRSAYSTLRLARGTAYLPDPELRPRSSYSDEKVPLRLLAAVAMERTYARSGREI